MKIFKILNLNFFGFSFSEYGEVARSFLDNQWPNNFAKWPKTSHFGRAQHIWKIERTKLLKKQTITDVLPMNLALLNAKL